MSFLDRSAHADLFTPETFRIGEILWFLLRAEQDKRAQALREVEPGRDEYTELGEEIGRDEIHWWVFKKETDHDTLRGRTNEALEASRRLRAASKAMRRQMTSYPDLLSTLKQFAVDHRDDLNLVADYLGWLRARHTLAPTILFTYRVWGSSRRGDRWIDLEAQGFAEEPEVIRQALTENALGLRRGMGLYTWDRAYMNIGEEIYNGDPENAGEIEVSDEDIAQRAGWETRDEFAVFFEWIRNSLENVALDIVRFEQQRNLLGSDSFWRSFIAAAVKSRTLETQRWDFKETLNIWHARGPGREAAKTALARDVAGFANGEGGVLLVGVTDDRRIVGITGDVESMLKDAADVISDRVAYPRRISNLRQVTVPNGNGQDVICVVIAVARSIEPVGASDGNGQFSYPVRRETGLSNATPRDLAHEKTHYKSDTNEFLDDLVQFIRDNPPTP